MYNCIHCNKTFTTQTSKYRHQRLYCKQRTNISTNLNLNNNEKLINKDVNKDGIDGIDDLDIKSILKELKDLKHLTINNINNTTIINNTINYNFDKMNSFDIMFKELNDLNKVYEFFLKDLPTSKNLCPIILSLIKQTGNDCPIKIDNNQIILCAENVGKIIDYEGAKLSSFVSKSAALGYVFSYGKLSNDITKTITTTIDNEIREKNIIIHQNGDGILPSATDFHHTYDNILKFKLKANQLLISK